MAISKRPSIEQAAILRGLDARGHYTEAEISGGNIRSLNVMRQKGWVSCTGDKPRVWRLTEMGRQIRNSLN